MPLKISNLGSSEPVHTLISRYLDSLPDGEVIVTAEMENRFTRSNIRSSHLKLREYWTQRVVGYECGGTGRLQRVWGNKKTIKKLESQ